MKLCECLCGRRVDELRTTAARRKMRSSAQRERRFLPGHQSRRPGGYGRGPWVDWSKRRAIG